MFSEGVLFYAVLGFGALAVGTIIYIVLDPLLSSMQRGEKRKQLVAGGALAKLDKSNGLIEKTRRRQVQDALDDMEHKAKKKAKVSLRLRLQRAGLESMKIKTFYMISGICALVLTLGMLLFGVPIYAALLGLIVGGLGLPRYVLSVLTKKRQATFLKEFITAIDIIVRGVKAGLPFNDCLQIITTEVGEPVRSEFLHLVEQQRIGVPVDQALEKLYDRVPLQEVNFFAIVVTIQLQIGGNVSEALANLAKVLRDRAQLKAKVQAVSMEAKSSAAIIAALPILVMVGASLTNPGYMDTLFYHPTGRLIMAGSAVVMVMGILVMRWMINFKI